MILTNKHAQQIAEVFGKKNGTLIFKSLKSKKSIQLNVPDLKSTIELRPNTSDIPTFFQVFIEGDYAINYPKSPKVIVDAGANIGLFTILMKNKFPKSTIISIEPDKENFIWLQKNVAAYKNVFCDNAGVWNKKANLIVHDKFGNGKWGMIVEESKTEGNVKALGIQDIMARYSLESIDILKIDIETSEKQLFLNNYSKWLPKVKMIIIELHDWIEPGCSKTFFTAINKTFSQYDYSIQGENTVIINKSL